MYPDNPNGPNGDSEVSSGNAPGQRVGLASYGPFKILPGAANSFTVAYYYVNSPRATPLQNVQALFDQPDVLQHAFDNCFEYVDFACNLTSKAQWLAAPTGLAIYPNPAATFFNIESKGAPFSRIQLFDQLGRSLRQIELENPASAFMVPAHDLPSGTYYVRVGSSVLPLFIQR